MLFVLVVCLNDIQNVLCATYDAIVELMNIHKIKCQTTNQANSGTSHDNLVRFSRIRSIHQCLLQFYKITTFSYDL